MTADRVEVALAEFVRWGKHGTDREMMAAALAAADALAPPTGTGPKVCPRCGSPDPRRHPAVQYEGEVQMCPDAFHAPREARLEGTLAKHQDLDEALTERIRELEEALRPFAKAADHYDRSEGGYPLPEGQRILPGNRDGTSVTIRDLRCARARLGRGHD